MSTDEVHRSLKILLADDGSQHAMTAVALLRDLAAGEGEGAPARIDRVTVIGVFTPRQAADHEALRAALDQSRALLQERGLNVESELVLGYPAEKLVEYSEQHLLDLIVVGAKGLRATLGILLGGVAQQVVEYAHTPVMVVRPPYSGLRRVLLVTDGSENSRRALEYLATFPLPKGAEITVMHVLPPLVIEQPPLAWSQPDFMARPTLPPVDLGEAQKWEKEEEAQGKAVLEQAVAALSAAGIQARSLLQRGDAATEIIEYANAHSVDLIVAGSRGLSTFQAWLLGSVSRKLVHYAGCSVLVVKGK